MRYGNLHTGIRTGELSPRWENGGSADAILEYCGYVGSVENFSDDDFAAALEENWTRGLIEDLCDGGNDDEEM